MAPAVVVSQSKVMPVAADEPFAMLPSLPLQTIYHRWYWAFPPIRRVVYTDGDWRRVGQKRTMVLAGATAVAEVVEVDPPRAFRYQLTEMTGLFAPLIRRVEGQVEFVPVSGGTNVTWQWTIHLRSGSAALARPVLRRLWPGWALKALDYIAAELEHPSTDIG